MPKTVLFMAMLAIAAVLGGCGSSYNYVIDTYRGTALVPYEASTGVRYRIFDKPEENKLMITASLGDAASIGWVKGATWGLVDSDKPVVMYSNAAIEWLASTGRSCQAGNAFELVQTQYEVQYECGPVAPALVATDVATQ